MGWGLEGEAEAEGEGEAEGVVAPDVGDGDGVIEVVLDGGFEEEVEAVVKLEGDAAAAGERPYYGGGETTFAKGRCAGARRTWKYDGLHLGVGVEGYVEAAAGRSIEAESVKVADLYVELQGDAQVMPMTVAQRWIAFECCVEVGVGEATLKAEGVGELSVDGQAEGNGKVVGMADVVVVFELRGFSLEETVWSGLARCGVFVFVLVFVIFITGVEVLTEIASGRFGCGEIAGVFVGVESEEAGVGAYAKRPFAA